ncbi:MAG: helix-hairpin-helix domain-containing protein [bacterium]
MFTRLIKMILIVILLVMLCIALQQSITSIEAKTVKIASYNVENLFDLANNGTEYSAYIPNTGSGWTKDIAHSKYTNIAQVIKDLKADVVALQEVESKKALITLRNRLKDIGAYYPYYEIAESAPTPVKCAVLSTFKIVEREEIEIDTNVARNILKITLDIDGNGLILFINHWKSKRYPESMRIADATALKKALEKLQEDVDFILIGDFNANYNEYETFLNTDRLNDTNGITGINHILKTINNAALVNETLLTKQAANEYLYNLWCEVDETRRWSYTFSGEKESPDNIIVSKALYDTTGISYRDNSFDTFQPDYLFNGTMIYRWQITERGKGRHLGKGYSDHLPIYAYFTTEPFRFINNDNPESLEPEKKEPAPKLLDLNTASKEELMSINGIGPVLSSRIIDGRPYKTVDDLLNIKGIGPTRLKQFRSSFFVK